MITHITIIMRYTRLLRFYGKKLIPVVNYPRDENSIERRYYTNGDTLRRRCNNYRLIRKNITSDVNKNVVYVLNYTAEYWKSLKGVPLPLQTFIAAGINMTHFIHPLASQGRISYLESVTCKHTSQNLRVSVIGTKTVAILNYNYSKDYVPPPLLERTYHPVIHGLICAGADPQFMDDIYCTQK